MRTLSALGLAVCLAALAGQPSRGDDWPQWRGPGRTAVSKETGLLETWPKAGPKLLWTCETAGLGYAGFAVVGGKVYTMGARGDDEYVLCLDEKGKESWATRIAKVYDFKGNAWSHGPNSTPTVDGDWVFALGSQGELACVNKADGKLAWRKNLPRELAAAVNPVGGGPAKTGWGFCWSPLVDGDKLICVPGGPRGLFAALDKASGKVLWRSKEATDQATYSSPIVAEIGKVRQYVYVVQDGVVGVSARDGALLWRHKRDDPYPDVVCPTPISHEGLVYVSVGYGGGCDLLKPAPDGKKFKVEVVYSQKEIGSKLSGVVLAGKSVYGYHEDRGWLCQEFEAGAIKWPKRPPAGALKSGGVIAAGGRLYILDETGVAGLVVADPHKYLEVGRFKLPKESKKRKGNGKVWTHPVLSDGKLYLRDQEYIFCYQVK
jgi:outer membrane protein assembly factor BamB